MVDLFFTRQLEQIMRQPAVTFYNSQVWKSDTYSNDNVMREIVSRICGEIIHFNVNNIIGLDIHRTFFLYLCFKHILPTNEIVHIILL